MATNYPAALNNWEDKVASQAVMAQHMNNLQDTIYQLQLKVGANATSLDNTLDYKINNFFVASTYLYFYENSAPIGWTATQVAGDMILAITASSGSYNATQEAQKGSWSLDSDINSDTHNHRWSYWYSPYSYTQKKDNSAIPIHTTWMGSVAGLGKRYPGFLTYCWSKNTSDYYDIKSRLWGADGYTNNDSHDHSFTTGWRPQTAVGVIANYTGP